MLLNKNDSLLVLIDMQEKLVPLVVRQDSIIHRCEWLLKLANKMNVPILASEQYPKGIGSTVSSLKKYISSSPYVEKLHFSCLQEPQYTSYLREYNKKQLILLGIEAHVCVLQTAFEMKDAGFEVFVVADAVSSRSEIDLKYGLKRMKQNGIYLITAEMVFFEWLRHSGVPNFKELSKEFLR